MSYSVLCVMDRRPTKSTRTYTLFPYTTLILAQAALGSGPRSMEDPQATHDANCTVFLNMLVAARDADVDSFTYAASSSTYGDEPTLPKVDRKRTRPNSSH